MPIIILLQYNTSTDLILTLQYNDLQCCMKTKTDLESLYPSRISTFLPSSKVTQFYMLLLLFSHSVIRLCVTPWTVARRAPLSMGFPRQEHWSGVPFSPPSVLHMHSFFILFSITVYPTVLHSGKSRGTGRTLCAFLFSTRAHVRLHSVVSDS